MIFYESSSLRVDGGSHFLTRAGVLPKAKAIVAAPEDDILGSCYKSAGNPPSLLHLNNKNEEHGNEIAPPPVFPNFFDGFGLFQSTL